MVIMDLIFFALIAVLVIMAFQTVIIPKIKKWRKK